MHDSTTPDGFVCPRASRGLPAQRRDARDHRAPAASRNGTVCGGTPFVDRDLGKTFRVGRGFFQHEDVAAVKDVTFSLSDNEFVGIVGESGSGKSTVARTPCGLETPTSGTITVSGRDVTQGGAAARQHLRSHVQMVFQGPQSALNPRRRVGSIVTQALEARGTGIHAARMARVQALLSEIGLPPEAAHRFPPQLSGGQRQRVNIARALCAEPRILIADEIVSGLDVSVQAQLLNLLLRLRRARGLAMLSISHDLSVVRYLCYRVLVMYRGEVVESGLTADVFGHPQHSYTKTLLAAVPPDDPATIGIQCRRRGWHTTIEDSA